MIRIRKEGSPVPLGLSVSFISRSWDSGGFVVMWRWFDHKAYQFTGWRFRVRLGYKPRVFWSRDRFDPATGHSIPESRNGKR